jgi:hypothetical protein
MESYFLINTSSNIVENTIDWDGNNSWSAIDNYIVIPRNTTPAKVWLPNEETRNFDLVTVVGAGDIGFIWNGTFLMTNKAQPEPLQTDAQTVINAKASALAKLTALGLTQEEVKALVG